MYLMGKVLCSVDFRTAWGKLGCFGMRIVRVLFARLQKLCSLSDCGIPMGGSLPSGLDGTVNSYSLRHGRLSWAIPTIVNFAAAAAKLGAATLMIGGDAGC
jgi:hypothetical protein